MSKNSVFETDIILGERYRDTATGFVGTATSVYFFEHACERVQIKGINKQGEVLEYVFDAPELWGPLGFPRVPTSPKLVARTIVSR